MKITYTGSANTRLVDPTQVAGHSFTGNPIVWAGQGDTQEIEDGLGEWLIANHPRQFAVHADGSTKDELMEIARTLEIEGRSSMTKEELEAAINNQVEENTLNLEM